MRGGGWEPFLVKMVARQRWGGAATRNFTTLPLPKTKKGKEKVKSW
jgi:hypothetical protein